MNDPVTQLIALAKRIEPKGGYFDGYSLIDILESDAASMEQFRRILSASAAEQLDGLDGDQDYGHVIGEAADALDLLPDDPRHFKTPTQLESLPADQMLGELCSACILNDTNAVEHLAAKIDVDTLDHNKQTPLGYAVGNNHIECVRILLRFGANPNRVENWGNTVMHHCATCVTSKDVFDLLVESGGDLAIKNDAGRTPIDEMDRKRRKEWSC